MSPMRRRRRRRHEAMMWALPCNALTAVCVSHSDMIVLQIGCLHPVPSTSTDHPTDPLH